MSHSERVMVFIDNRNIYFSFKKRHFNCDYRLFLNNMIKGRNNRGATLYMGIKIPISSEDAKFEKYLINTGITPVFLPVSILGGKIKEKRIDVRIAVDMIYNACMNHYDTAILVSGDADFLPAINRIKKMNKQINLWSFKKPLSNLLKKELESSEINYIDTILTKIRRK